jgi:hypothetical protein
MLQPTQGKDLEKKIAFLTSDIRYSIAASSSASFVKLNLGTDPSWIPLTSGIVG